MCREKKGLSTFAAEDKGKNRMDTKPGRTFSAFRVGAIRMQMGLPVKEEMKMDLASRGSHLSREDVSMVDSKVEGRWLTERCTESRRAK